MPARTRLAGHRDNRLAGRIMATLFYEPSTRTRLSFESAMLRLGGSVVGTEAAREFSSVIKGETLEDTIRMVSAYADVIVLRHDQAGAAARAAAVASVPVVNAGDGPGEHPTQALLDLYTIRCERGTADGVHIAFCGDLRYGRTVHSLAQLLSLYPGVRMTFVAPEVVQVGADLQARMAAAGVPFRLTERLDDVIDVGRRRVPDPGPEGALHRPRATSRRRAGRSASTARSCGPLPERAIVMHPLPRVDEIATEVDADPRAAYFRQARNGVAIRMALLDLLLG